MGPTTMATPPTATATTERGLLMPRLRLSPTTPMATPPTATATTERGLLMPRLSPTTPMATPPTATATMERGLLMPRLRLSPTTPMATPPTEDMATTERGLLRLRLSPTTHWLPRLWLRLLGLNRSTHHRPYHNHKSSGLLQYKFGNINLSKDVLLIAITAKLPSKTES